VALRGEVVARLRLPELADVSEIGVAVDGAVIQPVPSTIRCLAKFKGRRRHTAVRNTAVRMKTTLVLDDALVNRLREMAVRPGRTMSQLAEAAIRKMLDERPSPQPLPDLRTSGAATTSLIYLIEKPSTRRWSKRARCLSSIRTCLCTPPTLMP